MRQRGPSLTKRCSGAPLTRGPRRLAQFVPTVNDLVITMQDGTVLSGGKSIGDYGIKSNTCLKVSI